jgi:hypothetical protein
MNAMKCLTAVLLVVVFLPLTSSAAEMRDGLWEITTTMDMPGMKMPPQKTKHCYTKEDVKDQKKMVNTNKDCTITELNTVGNKVSWKMKCTGKNPGTFSGETTFTGDTYVSFMKMQAQGMAMNMKVNGKRVGVCK